MRHKAVRLFTVFICCLAIPIVASAADQDNKKKKQGQQHQQAQHPGQPGGKYQNMGNQNKGNKGVYNPNVANQGYKGNKGHKSFNNPNNPNNPNTAYKGYKGKNLPNNPNKIAGGQANKAKWDTKHYDNVARAPKTNIKSVNYENNYHIHGAENWQGAHYAAFRDYHCEWHDHDWWHGHYGANLVLIAGGWYFLNNGFWAPAWGYNPAQAYYPYNGPIYAYHNLPPDQVIANVQGNLQEQGYYTGEVDGLLGPLTQEALVNYQNSNGLAPTGSIDEPTLDALGMS